MTERAQVFGHSVGALRVHVVEDAPFKIDAGTMFGMVPRTRWEPLVNLDDRHRVQVTTWCLVVECPDALVLVETGFGTKLSDEMCRFYDWSNDRTVVDRMEELGFAPERFTHVVLTHMHLDHAGGLTRLGEGGQIEPVFPNATVVVQAAELDEARHPGKLTRGSYNDDDWTAIERAGRLHAAHGPAEVVPGVELLPTGGHSAGHQAVRITDGNDSLIYAGDILPATVNLRPAWVTSYDIDPRTTVEAKCRLCDRAIDEGAAMVMLHDPVHPLYAMTRDNRGRYHAEAMA